MKNIYRKTPTIIFSVTQTIMVLEPVFYPLFQNFSQNSQYGHFKNVQNPKPNLLFEKKVLLKNRPRK